MISNAKQTATAELCVGWHTLDPPFACGGGCSLLQVAGLRHLFQDMDTNGDGALTLAELQAALKSRRLNLTAQQAEVRSPPVSMP